MPWQVELDEEAGVVEVAMTGEFSVHEHGEARAMAMELCRERGARLVLADLTRMALAPDWTSFAFYEFGSTFDREEMPAGLRMAVIVPADPGARREAHFAADVADNRGIPMKLFGAVEAARSWLLSRRKED
jgi:hypothetical protein